MAKKKTETKEEVFEPTADQALDAALDALDTVASEVEAWKERYQEVLGKFNRALALIDLLRRPTYVHPDEVDKELREIIA